jgi:hypothetical protein
MRRFAFMLTLVGVTSLAGSALAQDTTAQRDSARRDSVRRDSAQRDTTHQRLHKRIPATSRGDVDTSRHKPPAREDTAKIREPSRRDSALVRQEVRTDTSSVARDTGARDTVARQRPKPDSQPKKPPPA